MRRYDSLRKGGKSKASLFSRQTTQKEFPKLLIPFFEVPLSFQTMKIPSPVCLFVAKIFLVFYL